MNNKFKLLIASSAGAAVTAVSLFVASNPPKDEFLINNDITDTVEIRIKYTKEASGFTYNDSLYYTLEEYANLSQEKIDAEKEKRFDNALQNFLNPPTPYEPTVEELEEQKAALEKQIEEINTQIEEKS